MASKQRPVRIPDDVWYRAVALSKRRGIPIGQLITQLLEQELTHAEQD